MHKLALLVTFLLIVATAHAEFEGCESQAYDKGVSSAIAIYKKSDPVKGKKYICHLAVSGDHRAQKQMSKIAFKENDYISSYIWASLSNTVAKRASKERLVKASLEKLSEEEILYSDKVIDDLIPQLATGFTFSDVGRRYKKPKEKVSLGTRIPDIEPIGPKVENN